MKSYMGRAKSSWDEGASWFKCFKTEEGRLQFYSILIMPDDTDQRGMAVVMVIREEGSWSERKSCNWTMT